MSESFSGTLGLAHICEEERGYYNNLPFVVIISRIQARIFSLLDAGTKMYRIASADDDIIETHGSKDDEQYN